MQWWIQIIGIRYKQQDLIAWFQILDVLNEKNARQWTNAVVLKGVDYFYFVSDWSSSDWGSRITELTVVGFKIVTLFKLQLFFVSYLFSLHQSSIFLWKSMRIACPRFQFLTRPFTLNYGLRHTLPVTHIFPHPQFSRAAKMSDATAKAPVHDPYFPFLLIESR